MAEAQVVVVIAPSLLSADFAHLAVAIARAEAADADWHHVDVMDGHFVPNLTVGPVVVRALASVATKPLDVHLMVTDPWTYAPMFLDAGAAGVTFHAELADRGDVGALLRAIRVRGMRAGLAVNPETPIDAVVPFLDELDMVLVMSVHPGFAGQKFIPEVLTKVEALREVHGFRGAIEMDGGLGRDTVGRCAAAGCSVFVAGSALYGTDDMGEEVRVFRERIGVALAMLSSDDNDASHQ